MQRSALFCSLYSVLASTTLPAQTTDTTNQVQLEEVIVTANRREENLQDVAISVSAFTDEFFKNSGTTSLKQLDQYTPSLKITPVTDTRSTSIRIRGIGSIGTNAGIDPSVGVFIDGVYQGRDEYCRPDRHSKGRSTARPTGHPVRQEHGCRSSQYHLQEARGGV